MNREWNPGCGLASFGQHFLVGLDGTELSENERQDLKELKPLGILLQPKNFPSEATLEATLNSVQGLILSAREATQQDELIVAFEYDGGQGFQFPAPLTALGSPREVAQDIQSIAPAFAKDLRSLGINMYLGPSANLAPAFSAPEKFKQFFSDSSDDVTTAACIFSQALLSEQIAPIPKHFPGQGALQNIPGENLPLTNLLKAEIMNRDVKPFAALIDLGVPGIMVSSGIYAGIDRDFPALMSQPILREILRKHLGFEGVIFSDEIASESLLAAYLPGEVMRAATQASVDVFKVGATESACNLAVQLEDVHKLRLIPEAEVAASVGRIQRLIESLV